MTICYLAIFGLIIGSFLNVCIYRVPRKLSVVSPARSYCPKCNTQLSSLENVPVLSWLFLGGKCKTCKAPISGQYPLVEALSAIAAAACFMRFGLTPTGVVLYALVAALIVITFIDFEFKIIPNVISYPGITIGLIIGAVSQYTGVFQHPISQSAWDSLLGMYAGGGFFWVIGEIYFRVTKTVGLGGGDVKLMGMTGAILGFNSIPTTIFLGSLAGSIVGIATIVLRGGNRKSEIPFGPWLSLGCILYIFTDINFFGL